MISRLFHFLHKNASLADEYSDNPVNMLIDNNNGEWVGDLMPARQLERKNDCAKGYVQHCLTISGSDHDIFLCVDGFSEFGLGAPPFVN
jgi:hypothetical protein